MDAFKIIPPVKKKVPIVVSVPHCGIALPPEVKPQLKPDMVGFIDDTDWYVDRLYDFTTDLGITMISAVYSRWVIDLNRAPGSEPLYQDGRIITELLPTTDFLGNPLYLHAPPDPKEIARRSRLYYYPYHQALEQLLLDLKEEFGKVILFDAHSIRQHVPTISPKKFPDAILGDNNGKSADTRFVTAALQQLKLGAWQVEHNYLFKGGHITRKFGQPKDDIHAIQLEMTKINYMDSDEKTYHPAKANNTRKILENTFNAIIDLL